MANVLIDHLNNQPQNTDSKNRETIEWMEKRDFYDYEVIYTFSRHDNEGLILHFK